MLNHEIADARFNPNVVNGGGVSVWSTPEGHSSYVIFCLGNNPEREAAFARFAKSHGIPYKALKGSYKGVEENSFISNSDHWPEIKGWVWGEESVLLLGPANEYGAGRSASLLFAATGEMQPLGTFKQVPEEYALRQEAWTFDPTQNAYFVAK